MNAEIQETRAVLVARLAEVQQARVRGREELRVVTQQLQILAGREAELTELLALLQDETGGEG